MKPVTARHFSFLIDSLNLIQLTQNLIFTKNSKFLTADFDSLFSNISIDKSIEIISDMMKKVKSDHLTTYGFHSLLKFFI